MKDGIKYRGVMVYSSVFTEAQAFIMSDVYILKEMRNNGEAEYVPLFSPQLNGISYSETIFRYEDIKTISSLKLA